MGDRIDGGGAHAESFAGQSGVEELIVPQLPVDTRTVHEIMQSYRGQSRSQVGEWAERHGFKEDVERNGEHAGN